MFSTLKRCYDWTIGAVKQFLKILFYSALALLAIWLMIVFPITFLHSIYLQEEPMVILSSNKIGMVGIFLKITLFGFLWGGLIIGMTYAADEEKKKQNETSE